MSAIRVLCAAAAVAAAAAVQVALAARPAHVLIIGIDGLGGDWLLDADAPRLQGLIRGTRCSDESSTQRRAACFVARFEHSLAFPSSSNPPAPRSEPAPSPPQVLPIPPYNLRSKTESSFSILQFWSDSRIVVGSKRVCSSPSLCTPRTDGTATVQAQNCLGTSSSQNWHSMIGGVGPDISGPFVAHAVVAARRHLSGRYQH